MLLGYYLIWFLQGYLYVQLELVLPSELIKKTEGLFPLIIPQAALLKKSFTFLSSITLVKEPKTLNPL